MSDKIKVAVLLGGKSSEHEVSLNSGIKVANVLDRELYEILPVKIEKNGQWLLALDVLDELITDIEDHFKNALIAPPASAVEVLIQERVDVVFIALHGKFGEDGVLQGILEMASLPYTGSGVSASALAMDKVRSNTIYSHHGLLVPRFFALSKKEWEQNIDKWTEQIAALGLPVVIKPTNDGSSVGTYIVKQEDDIEYYTKKAYEVSDSVMFQEYISGDEVTCAVLEINGDMQALPPTLIRPIRGDFFDYEAKYTQGASQEITPAPLPDSLIQKIQATALSAHILLGCASYSRTDMIIRDDNIFLLETNTLPGLTNTSLVPQAAYKAGIEFDQLINIIIENALK